MTLKQKQQMVINLKKWIDRKEELMKTRLSSISHFKKNSQNYEDTASLIKVQKTEFYLLKVEKSIWQGKLLNLRKSIAKLKQEEGV